MPIQLSPKDMPWLAWPQVQQVLAWLNQWNIEHCFYGGVARDALLGREPVDIDIIVFSSQERLLALFKDTGLKPAVLDERTARIMVDGVQFDFTAPLPDNAPPATDFHTCAARAAGRAEFSINALYLFPNGALFDDVGGVQDALDGRIRFPGNPEHYLVYNGRVPLRFFRLYAWFGKGDPDPASLDVCVRMASKMLDMKRDMIFRDLRKLLAAPFPYRALELMRERDVLKYAMGFPITDFSFLQSLQTIEALIGQPSDWRVRFVLLLLGAPLAPEKAMEHLKTFWELDADELGRLTRLLDYFPAIDTTLPPEEIKAALAQVDANTARSLLLIRWALEENVTDSREGYMTVFSLVG